MQKCGTLDAVKEYRKIGLPLVTFNSLNFLLIMKREDIIEKVKKKLDKII